MKFILIVIALGSGSPDVSMQEFDDEAACKSALTFVVKSINEKFMEKSVSQSSITARCEPKASLSE